MKRLEIGCGSRPTEGFLHQDVADLPELDFRCQPYEILITNLDLIIAVGVMEHLRLWQFRQTLWHFLVILENAGKFLFDVPDFPIWCQYYLDSYRGLPTPFEHEHILSTIFGWHRWEGDEHHSGWSVNDLKQLIESIHDDTYKFMVEFCTPAIFQDLGIERPRFSRSGDAHLYVSLTKVKNE